MVRPLMQFSEKPLAKEVTFQSYVNQFNNTGRMSETKPANLNHRHLDFTRVHASSHSSETCEKHNCLGTRIFKTKKQQINVILQ